MMAKKELPEKNKLFFTPTGFGIKRISKEAIRKNFDVLKQIAEQARKYWKKDEH